MEKVYNEEEMRDEIQKTIELFNEIPIYKMLKPSLVKCISNSIIIKFPVQNWELNHMKTLHGGIIATVIDTVSGILTSYLCNSFVIPTINLSINYHEPATNEENLFVMASADRVGKNLVSISAKAYVSDVNTYEMKKGKIIATGISNFYVIKQN